MTDAPADAGKTKASAQDEAGKTEHAASAAKGASPASAETPEGGASQDASGRPVWSAPASRALFWAASAIALAGAGVAIAASASAGWNGFILLCGLAFVAFLLLYALAAGEAAGRALSGKSSSKALGPTAAALEALPDPVLLTDRHGRVLYANAAYCSLAREAAGLGAGLGAPTPDRVWPAGGAAAVYRLSRAASEGRESAREVLPPLRMEDGQMAVFAAEARRTGDGGVVWRFTEERASETDAAVAPDWAAHAPVGLFLADGEGRVLASNDTLRAWLGKDEGAALKIRDLFAGDTARAFAKSRGSDAPVRIDARLVGADGAENPVVVSVQWDDQRPPRARGVIYALSATGAPPGLAQTLAERGGEAGDTLDEMFAAAPFGVAQLDGPDPETAMVEDANPALLQISAGGAVPGARFSELFEFADGEDAEAVFDRALAGRGEPVEARLREGEKTREVHLFLAAAREGRRTAYIVDITAQKDLERQFAQGAKMQAVGQLAGGVAHDFNNMLTVIRLGTDDLLTRHPVGDPSYQSLQQINSTVHRAAALVKKLLAFSRKQTFKVQPLELPDFLSDISMLLRPMLEESVKLEIRHDRDVPMVRADITQLENALMNLATNARDAMKPKGGVLEIVSEGVDADAVRQAGAPDPKAGRWAAIHVRDQGCGMDKATLAKIFEPFFTTKAPGEGTGLGLSTVYGIVKQSGGFLFADSIVGEGTTFTLYLPEHIPSAEERTEITETKAAEKAEPEPSDLAGHGRILLVEDEDGVRMLAAQSLVKRGYEVVEACDGEEALEILEDAPGSFDLLISDVVMPGLDGPGLLREGREYLGDARIIFISGYAEEEFSHTLSSEAEVSFLSKPFTVPKLAERVKAELSRKT
ncbi:MAG: ATP-binding protein [Pseudomonadota bacterium]